jgi:PhnB protein
MIKLNPYLTLPGTAAQAIELYKKVFKVEPTTVQKFKDVPPQEGMPKPSATGGERIIHAGFQIGNDMLMISDAPEGQNETVVMGTQVHVSLHPDSKDEADRMFGLLSEGGQIVMPMAMQFWGDYFGMCRDKFGVRWMVNYHEEKK